MYDSRGEKNLRELNSRSPRKLNDVATRVTVVAKEKGNDDFMEIQDVVNAVPTNNMNLVLILVKPDIYEEKVTIPAKKLFIILSGSGANNTIITWNDSEKSSGGTYYCTTMYVYHHLSPCIKSWKLATC
jgi:pectin methylesterase-like acyl-CoA thioesterase